MENTELVLPRELNEVVRDNTLDRIQANTFPTKKKETIRVDGKTDIWHIVKWGCDPEKSSRVDPHSVQYDVIFNPNPERMAWLKTVPPVAKGSIESEERLKKAARIGRAAIELAGLPEYASQVIEYDSVRTEGVYGFVTPHLGLALDDCMKRLKIGIEQNQYSLEEIEQAYIFFGKVYDVAFRNAAALYLSTGYWTKDPNPGNIIIHVKDGRIYLPGIDYVSGGDRHSRFPNPRHDSQRTEKLMAKLREELSPTYIRHCATDLRYCAERGIPTLDLSEPTLRGYIDRFFVQEVRNPFVDFAMVS